MFDVTGIGANRQPNKHQLGVMLSSQTGCITQKAEAAGAAEGGGQQQAGAVVQCAVLGTWTCSLYYISLTMRSERLVFALKRQLVPSEATVGSHQFGPPWAGQAAGGTLPQAYTKSMPMDEGVVYLGEVRRLGVLLQVTVFSVLSGYCCHLGCCLQPASGV